MPSKYFPELFKENIVVFIIVQVRQKKKFLFFKNSNSKYIKKGTLEKRL